MLSKVSDMQTQSNATRVSMRQVQPGDDSRPQRVFLRDLRKHSFIKGDELQVCVVELQSPGRFFVHSQSPEMTELLRAITAMLEQTYGGPPGTNYSPHVGEVCVVRYSQDQKWYRGVVQSLSADQTIANVLYIDFGNEEAVTLEQIRSLAAHMDPVPPCALECRVAGVTPLMGSWTEKCCIALRMLLVGKSLTLTVAEASEEDHTYAVDVALSALGQQLSTFLLDQDYAAKEVSWKPTVEDIDSASLENFRRSGGKEGEGEEDAGARALDPLTQGLGDSFSATVTHLQTPDDIICQKLDNAKNREDILKPNNNKLTEVLEETNIIYKEVRQAPEAVLDAQLLVLAADLGKEKASQLHAGGSTFDPAAFTENLLEKNEESHQEATEKEVERILGYLPSDIADDLTPISYYEFVIDPNSFSRTVENIFHTSFLIRDGLARVYLDNDKFPWIAPVEEGEVEAGGSSTQQCVFSISPAYWRELIDVFDITEPWIPAPSTQAQSDLGV